MTTLPSQSCDYEAGRTVRIAKAETRLGNNSAYPEEAERNASFGDYDIDAYEVTNDDFAKFVADTGYVTTAERPQPGFDVPGAAVFTMPDLKNTQWWRFVEGAQWRHPEGPDSDIEDRGLHPVVQVSFEDAKAYAAWAKRDIPTEAEWEYAAKAGSDTLYVWGDTLTPDGREMANTWQGAFPLVNTVADGYSGTAPVGCFDANDFGLYDAIGNVWEWTQTEYGEQNGTSVRAIKGGSYLCAPNYCARYRGSARQPQEVDFSTNHIGFRTVSRAPAS